MLSTKLEVKIESQNWEEVQGQATHIKYEFVFNVCFKNINSIYT